MKEMRKKVLVGWQSERGEAKVSDKLREGDESCLR